MSAPRVGQWLLARMLDAGSHEAVAGDLEEGYRRLRASRGRIAATIWFWQQAIRSVIACRITGRRRADARRFDFEPGPWGGLRDLAQPAFRQFRDRPLYSLTIAGTLALAVGASAASLAVVKRALVDPLPYPADDELVSLLTSVDGMTSAVSPHVLLDLRASNPPLVQFAPIRPTSAIYTQERATESVNVSFVDSSYFALLGATVASGRLWESNEVDALVVTARFARERLPNGREAIGQTMVLDGRPRTVVGVMRADFVPPYFMATEAWAPLDLQGLLADLRTRRTLTVLARRAPGIEAEQLDTFLALFTRQLQDRLPIHAGQSFVARGLRDELVGPARSALVGTALAAALLLLIVAANIAGLSTAQAVTLRHQTAVRAALGATPARLLAEHCVESAVLALLGAVAGVGAAYALIAVFAPYQPVVLARLGPIALDGSMAVAFGAIGTIVGLAAALLPRVIVGAGRGDVLRSARSSTDDVTVRATRSGLVIAQVAIALVLVVAAGLLVRTIHHLSQRNLGFDSSGVTWLQVTFPGTKYQSSERQIQAERDIVERVRQVPGVSSVMASVGFPLTGGSMAGLAIKGETPGTPRREIAYLSVAPGFVGDIRARIVAGRDVDVTDTLRTDRVVVINETMARMFWPKGDAIGAQVYIGPGAPGSQWITVVGIMADMRTHGLTEPIRPTAFGTTWQYSWPRRHIAVRTESAASGLVASNLKAAIQSVDPSIAVGAISTAEQTLANSLARHRLVTLSVAVFGTVAIVLCVCGLYAVVALNAQQRRREYAIRVALGARPGGVRWMVVRHALVLTGLGIGIGVALAVVSVRAIQGMLHEVQPIDGPTFALAMCGLAALATLAAWQPARRAERVDPVEVLRAE